MPGREVFAALDGKLRIVATLRAGPPTNRQRTQYDVELAPDKYASAWLYGLTREHLVAMHHALSQELARTAMQQEARFRR